MATGFKTAQVNASSVPATATDFPSYVDLDRLGITTTAEAESVRVYADEAKTTEWAREIVSATEMHVKVPSLTSTTDMYVDWDGVRSDYATTATYGAEAVWSSSYQAVYHFEDLLVDSTSNSYDLTNVNTVTQDTSAIGQGADSGTGNTNKRLKRTDNVGITNTDAVTYSIYFSPNEQPATDTYQNYMYQIWRGGDFGGDRRMTYANVGGTKRLYSSWAKSPTGWTGDWYDITVATGDYVKVDHTFSGGATGGTYKMYVNGVERFSTAIDVDRKFSNTGGEGTNQIDFYSGEAFWYGSFTIADSTYSKIARSANWITTEYNNQSDEATFWGTWSEVGGGATFTPTSMVF